MFISLNPSRKQNLNSHCSNFKVCLSQNLKYTLFQEYLKLSCVMISLDTSILSKLDSNLYSGKVSWPLSTVYSIFEALENSLKNGYFFQCMSILGLLKAVIFYWKLSFSILNYFSSHSNEISQLFFLTVTWLAHSPLWATVEGAVSSTQC